MEDIDFIWKWVSVEEYDALVQLVKEDTTRVNRLEKILAGILRRVEESLQD